MRNETDFTMLSKLPRRFALEISRFVKLLILVALNTFCMFCNDFFVQFIR